MLMTVYNVDEAAAFELLRWRSQETNVKLVLLAQQITADFTDVGHGEVSRPTYDTLFLTAHTRARRAGG
jgi:ANTAR domain